eukprot:1900900-Prorocentrum_lima.AAC.1
MCSAKRRGGGVSPDDASARDLLCRRGECGRLVYVIGQGECSSKRELRLSKAGEAARGSLTS